MPWKPVVGYEGLYEVSDAGQVRNKKGHILSPCTHHAGHKSVMLYRAGTRSLKSVHSLVLAAFVGPRPAGHVTRHLNNIPDDNRLANLAWGTQSENMYDKRQFGTHHQAKKTHCPRGHELAAPNLRPTALRRGFRECWACSRARNILTKRPYIDMQVVSDEKYQTILREAVNQ